MMTDNQLLIGLKVDLGIATDAFDERLLARLGQARAEIAAEGITLTDSVRDNELVVRYAGWLWARRVAVLPTGEASQPAWQSFGAGGGMPRMLRFALNNRLLAEKARGSS